MRVYNKIKVKRIKQNGIGYCGPASLQILLSAVNIDLNQENIMNSIGIPEDKRAGGTRIDQLAQIIESHVAGYALLAKYNSTVLDLHLMNRKYHLPAGIEWQGSFTEPESYVYDEGHYSVVLDTDINLSKLIIIDPDDRSTFKNGILSFEQLEKRWWDVNHLPCGNNGSMKILEVYNEKLIFIIIPRNDIVIFAKIGFHPATLELIKEYQKEPHQLFRGQR
jgi:hypothetical protein